MEGRSADGQRGPRPLSEVLGALFAARGYGRLRAARELEAAWEAAVGEPACRQSKVGGVRHGVLSVTVAHPTLLEELAAFRKPALLAALRRAAPETPIQDIRFKVGPIAPPAPEPEADDPPRPKSPRRRRGA
ncbi:MAG TPA: DciA family protein [Isosphaeraceae bacterium]|jgi:predicted nucleic acid-binding Zn ribbon protein|nr:DciA family protein [Isosphaeraceae bacterium]